MSTTTLEASPAEPCTFRQDAAVLLNPHAPTPVRVRAAESIVHNLAPTECACPRCASLCRVAPCIGTPEDMERLVAAGFAHKLRPSTYAALLSANVGPIDMVAPLQTQHGCTFLTEDGKCSLHHLGLKPTEGKLASACTHTRVEALALSLAVAGTWLEDYDGSL